MTGASLFGLEFTFQNAETLEDKEAYYRQALFDAHQAAGATAMVLDWNAVILAAVLMVTAWAYLVDFLFSDERPPE